MPDPAPRRRARWPDLFHGSARPLFVLSKARRLRFANPAWEQLAGRPLADAAGMACVRTGPTEPLFRTLAPPPEATSRPVTVRRLAPPHAAGPPWWDITFVPLPGPDGGTGFLGIIAVVAPEPPDRPRKVSPIVAGLRAATAARFPFDLFAGDTPTADRFLAQVRLAASSVAPVWVVGEPGSGKETLARVLHHNGPTKERAFVGLDAGGVQPYLLDALLFGHGGLASSGRIGTLYLREPAALPRDLQQRLADWLAGPGPIPRLVCSSSSPAADTDMVPDFLARLAVLELHLPPLRNRPDAIPRLADHFAGPGNVPADVLAVLRAHAWPGNVRELSEVLAAAGEGGPVLKEKLPRYVRERALVAADPRPAERTWTLDEVLTAVEKRLIALALKEANGSQTDAAAKLGVFRARLGRRIEALGIKP